MQHKKFLACASAAVLALAMACSKQSTTPVSPTAALPGTGEAAADGSTLKVSAPTPQSPINGQQPDLLTLTTGAATAEFTSTPALQYEFEIYNGANQRVYRGVQSGGSASISHAPTATLEMDQPHTWRVRATYAGANGPWSANASFKSPAGGYIRGNEVFDPLVNGKSVADIFGAVTFIPGVGARLENFDSFLRYRLPQTLLNGEFSMIVTGVETNTEGGKTKIMSMSEGSSDLITNDRRMTIEKRGDPPGIIAWRFISHLSQIDTEGAERQYVEFDPNKAYLWTATWNGTFTVRVQEGGAGGRVIYNKSKSYKGEYDPDPHYCYAGAPIGRSGPDAATVPGMIVRNVWISPRPRPAGI